MVGREGIRVPWAAPWYCCCVKKMRREGKKTAKKTVKDGATTAVKRCVKLLAKADSFFWKPRVAGQQTACCLAKVMQLQVQAVIMVISLITRQVRQDQK